METLKKTFTGKRSSTEDAPSGSSKKEVRPPVERPPCDSYVSRGGMGMVGAGVHPLPVSR